MNTFDIYVHGTPRGHQIWGSEHKHDYISTFYNHDTPASEKVILQIDVCGGDSFYTYMRHQNVYDVEGRPQAFFALTVGFRRAYSTNVYRLYQLLDAVYNQICVGSILKQSGNGESYIVADLITARSGVNATVDKIQAAFTQKIAELIVPTLQPLSFGDTFNRAKKTVSLQEVDSPLFFDYVKRYSVIVSPNMQPSAVAYDEVSNELKQVAAQKKALLSSNEHLQSEISSLTQENKTLSSQLHASASSADKKYKAKIEQLQNDLNSVTDERDSLKKKILEATNSIEQIDQPFQKLTRLLAGRFPEGRSQKHHDHLGDKQEINSKSQTSAWTDWVNIILLGLVLICCCIILAVVLRTSPEGSDNVQQNSQTEEVAYTTVTNAYEDEGQVEDNESSIDGNEEEMSYDSWDECILNIRDGGDNLSLNKEYALSVTKNGKKANVPDGEWFVFIQNGVPINNGNTFTITDQSTKGKNLMIEYRIDGKPVKTRLCIIQ